MTQTLAVASRAGPPFLNGVASWCVKMLDIYSIGAASYDGQKRVEDRVYIGNIIYYYYSGNSSSSPKANVWVRPGTPRLAPSHGAIVKGHLPS